MGGALRGDGLRFFLAANVGHIAVSARPWQLRQVFFSLHVLATPATASPNESNGNPSSRSAESRATISDSVDECDTTVCFLHTALTGKNVLGPTSAAKTPVVDLDDAMQSANEASVKSMMDNLSDESPIHPCKQCVRVVSM